MAKKLLLVEDNLSIQHVVQTIFRADAFEVAVVSEATACLHTMESWLPDIVLADASMPDIDGFQLCQIIRNIANLRHIPVVLLTSRFAAYDATKGERVGVTAHLPKPFESQTLFDMVQRLLAPPMQDVPKGLPSSLASATLLASQDEGPSVPVQTSPGEGGHDLRRAAAMAQHPSASDTALPVLAVVPEAVYASLGRDILHILQHSLEGQIASIIEKITPQIVEAVRDAVLAQAPALLEMLLQREIDKLKHAADHDDTWSLKS